MPFCPQCGKEVDETDRFCPNCGAQLVGREEVGPPEAVKEAVGVAQKYYEDKFSEVTIANVGFVSFPQRCPRCLAPNPGSRFTLIFNEWIGVNRWRKWSLKAPICGSCHKSKLRRGLKLIPIIGFIFFVATSLISIWLVVYLSFPLWLVVYVPIGSLLVACILGIGSGILFATILPKPPVKVKSCSSADITLWFENPEYGSIFSEANRRF